MGRHKVITICSDSVGETAEAVVKATVRQFQNIRVEIKRYSRISNEEEIKRVVEETSRDNGFIAYTLVQPELREVLRIEAVKAGVRAVDIMGPMMQSFIDTFNGTPLKQPGLLHELDDEYFRRVDAIEFAVKYDDGKDASGLLKAEVVLIGISRTSKTPLSIFLAHKGIKAANLPLVPEVKPPEELLSIPKERIIGLTMDEDANIKVRKERLKSIGLPFNARYATLDRVKEEANYAKQVMDALQCKVLHVGNLAIEESAAIIIQHLSTLGE